MGSRPVSGSSKRITLGRATARRRWRASASCRARVRRAARRPCGRSRVPPAGGGRARGNRPPGKSAHERQVLLDGQVLEEARLVGEKRQRALGGDGVLHDVVPVQAHRAARRRDDPRQAAQGRRSCPRRCSRPARAPSPGRTVSDRPSTAVNLSYSFVSASTSIMRGDLRRSPPGSLAAQRLVIHRRPVELERARAGRQVLRGLARRADFQVAPGTVRGVIRPDGPQVERPRGRVVRPERHGRRERPAWPPGCWLPGRATRRA